MARLANLPAESAVSFLASIGSMIAAHTITAQYFADGRLNRQELVLSGVLNTVPFHLKETFTFQLPRGVAFAGGEIVFALCHRLLAHWGDQDSFRAGLRPPKTQSANPSDMMPSKPWRVVRTRWTAGPGPGNSCWLTPGTTGVPCSLECSFCWRWSLLPFSY